MKTYSVLAAVVALAMTVALMMQLAGGAAPSKHALSSRPQAQYTPSNRKALQTVTIKAPTAVEQSVNVRSN